MFFTSTSYNNQYIYFVLYKYFYNSLGDMLSKMVCVVYSLLIPMPLCYATAVDGIAGFSMWKGYKPFTTYHTSHFILHITDN